jgi:hypothetical protein
MNLTDEQHAICQAARDLDVGSSLKIQAFAGTGKTTTLAAIAESLGQRKFLYLVFNRAAADEAEHKMPSNVTVRTAHALAFRSVGYVYKSRLASSPWAWFPYLKEKMPRALDSVVRMGAGKGLNLQRRAHIQITGGLANSVLFVGKIH